MSTLYRFLPGFFAVCSFLVCVTPVQSSAADLSVVERWLATNSGLRSIRIDFSQTRTMRSLKVPIRQSGSLWLNYSTGQFRWQSGNPPQTIVVRRGRDLYILRTALKKYEKRPYGSGGAPGMAALAGGFPRSLSEFQRKYRVLEITRKDNTHRIVTQPLGSAGQGVSSFTFVVASSGYRLLGIEMNLKDGSSVNTVFNRVQPNAIMPSSLFAPDLTGYREAKF